MGMIRLSELLFTKVGINNDVTAGWLNGIEITQHIVIFRSKIQRNGVLFLLLWSQFLKIFKNNRVQPKLLTNWKNLLLNGPTYRKYSNILNSIWPIPTIAFQQNL
jgi:hypothetical protein